MFVYFGLFLHTITTVLEMVIARTMCHTSDTYTFAYTLLEVLGIVFTFFALGALLRTYSRFSTVYQELHLFRTFWVFKGHRADVHGGVSDHSHNCCRRSRSANEIHDPGRLRLGRAIIHGLLPVVHILLRLRGLAIQLAISTWLCRMGLCEGCRTKPWICLYEG